MFLCSLSRHQYDCPCSVIQRTCISCCYGPWNILYELQQDKTNKMTCAPSEDSRQPGHLPSLIRVFAVRMKKHWVFSYPLSAQWRLLIRLGRCLGWSESLLVTRHFVDFVMLRLIERFWFSVTKFSSTRYHNHDSKHTAGCRTVFNCLS